MRDDTSATAASKSGTGDGTRHAAQPGAFEQTGRPAATPQRTVGVYDRPARRAGLSLPLLVIMILAALVSIVFAARFLF